MPTGVYLHRGRPWSDERRLRWKEICKLNKGLPSLNGRLHDWGEEC
jgi:hypothetical protein